MKCCFAGSFHWRLLVLFLLLTGSLSAADNAALLARQPVPAQLVPERQTTLASELAGKIERIAVAEGEFFDKGDTLVELDCALQQAQLVRAKAQRRAARATYNGNRELAGLNAIGKVEMEKSAAEMAVAQAEVRYLEVMLKKCRILAPFAGAAGQWQVQPQQYVQAGQAIIDVHDHRALRVEFIVPTAWLDWFEPGYGFSIHIEDSGKAYPARLLRTAARADPVSQSIQAVAVLDGDFPELIAGMSGYLTFTSSQPEGDDAAIDTTSRTIQ